MTASQRGLSLGGAVMFATVLVGGCGRAPAAAGQDGLRREVAALQRSTTLLQRQIELAASKDFYLVFDPAAPDLSLMLRGAELQRYAVLGAQVGRARVAWFGRRADREWHGVVWTDGTLEPLRQIDRLVVQGAEPGTAGAEADTEVKPPPIPPTAEELYPVPSRYLIRFAGGLSVEVRPREADADRGRWARLRAWAGAKSRDVGAAVQAKDRDMIRLRLVLKPKDAESLYRALPPAVRLIVL